MMMRPVVIGCIAALLVTTTASGEQAASQLPRNPVPPGLKDYQIVPCLLPARVRKLGGMVYPERRRLTKTTALKCELRGGEYTFYDRGAPESSIAFFQPLAEGGDPVAQTNLGEVYQYLFEEPRYAEAAEWYRKAADQGDATALRRLAHLHEQGLGVQKDALLAANLWRQSVGTDEDLVLASELEAVRTDADERIAALSEELRARNAETETIRRALESAEQDLESRRGAFAQAAQELAALRTELEDARSQAGGDPTRLAALERDLAERERVIEDQRFRIESMEADLGAQQARLLASVKQAELENRRLQQELERVTAASDQELAAARDELAAKTAELTTLQQQQAELTAKLTEERNRLGGLEDELRDLRAAAGTNEEAAARLRVLESERDRQAQALAQRETRVKELETRLAQTQQQASQLQASLDRVTNERNRLDAELASSEAELLAAREGLASRDAELDGLRDQLSTSQRERERLRTALASASSSNAADQLRNELQSRERDIARVQGRLQEVIAQRDDYRAQVQRLQEQRSMQLATRSMIDPLPDTSKIKLPRSVKVGKAYALVIGNDSYANWRPLNFARSDAKKVHEALSTRYGFESKLVVDAQAADIFREFQALDENLGPEDLLVIYYAGHGVQLGRVSYWLGVDAPSGRVALQPHGVSSDQLSDWLSALPAKHVLVISDSCHYTGAGIETTGGMKYTANDVEQQLKFYLGNRSRTLISAGGDEPVPDGDAGEGSRFTNVLVSLLNENKGVLFADNLFEHLKERMRYGGDALVGVPTPVFARIERAGHATGQFVFIRPSVRQS